MFSIAPIHMPTSHARTPLPTPHQLCDRCLSHRPPCRCEVASVVRSASPAARRCECPVPAWWPRAVFSEELSADPLPTRSQTVLAIKPCELLMYSCRPFSRHTLCKRSSPSLPPFASFPPGAVQPRPDTHHLGFGFVLCFCCLFVLLWLLVPDPKNH